MAPALERERLSQARDPVRSEHARVVHEQANPSRVADHPLEQPVDAAGAGPGMKYLPRARAFGKLKALAGGAALVRAEL